MWEVEQSGTFGNWFANLDEGTQEDIRAIVGVLAARGPMLGRPLVDSIEGSRHGNMKELRVQSKGRPFRIFFAFDPFRKAVLLIGGNKQGKKRFYEEMIPKADAIFDQYIERIKRR